MSDPRPPPSRETIIGLFNQADAEIARINTGINDRDRTHANQIQQLRNEFQNQMASNNAEFERRLQTVLASLQAVTAAQAIQASQNTPSQNTPSTVPVTISQQPATRSVVTVQSPLSQSKS